MAKKKSNQRGRQSDVIVDQIKRYGLPFITLNPGASFRGMHDSQVNYGDNDPPMMLCQHAKAAIQSLFSGGSDSALFHNRFGVYKKVLWRFPALLNGGAAWMREWES